MQSHHLTTTLSHHVGAHVGIPPNPPVLCNAINIIVQITRFSDGTRKIISLTEITGMYEGEVLLQEIFTYKRTGMSAEGRVIGFHTATGVIPGFVEELREAGVAIDMGMFVPKMVETG